jgi:DNA-binding transcriptional LysR family regulator
MSPMDIGALEIRLLEVFEAILRSRSVTAAADSLGVTQPAASQALGKLRRCLGDPLFVRTPQGMEPTARGAELAGPIGEMLALARDRLARPVLFDPARAERTFSVFASDAGAAVFAPRVVQRLARVAPGVRLRVAPVVRGRFPLALADGEGDLAFGSFPALGAGFYQQRLYEDDYVCLARRGTDAAREPLTLKRYLAARHVVVSSEGTGHAHGAVERQLADALAPGRIIVRVPSFLAALPIAAQSDCILTVPRRVALGFGAARLRVLAPPLPLPRFEVRQYWHERQHADAANRWFRGLVAELFGEPVPAG